LFSLSLLLGVFTALSAVEDGFFFSFFSFFSFFFFFFTSNPSTVCTAGTLAAVVTSVSLPELGCCDSGTDSRACDDAGVTCTPFA
ncbi:hypothetical protein N302_05246, partial [Corvus brachyrhynchos]